MNRRPGVFDTWQEAAVFVLGLIFAVVVFGQVVVYVVRHL